MSTVIRSRVTNNLHLVLPRPTADPSGRERDPFGEMTMANMDLDRLHELRDGPDCDGPVLYWMSRDQRAADNWALLYAQQEAIRRNVHPNHRLPCSHSTFLASRDEVYEISGLVLCQTYLFGSTQK